MKSEKGCELEHVLFMLLISELQIIFLVVSFVQACFSCCCFPSQVPHSNLAGVKSSIKYINLYILQANQMKHLMTLIFDNSASPTCGEVIDKKLQSLVLIGYMFLLMNYLLY